MMTQAFYTGISGLQNYSTGINVVSNNIANISTVGFRGYNAEFSNLYQDALTTSPIAGNSVGVGTQLQTTSMMQDQGSLVQSNRNTDLAILGDGWFGIQSGGKPVYTRNGTFGFDKNDNLVTDDGYYVLGTIGNNITKDNVLSSTIDTLPLGNVTTQQKLRFPKTLSYPPVPTQNADFFANLGVGYDPISMGATVVDGKNNKNRLNLEFVKNKAQTPPGSQYTLTATTSSADGTVVYDTQKGAVKFDDKGALLSNTLTSINNNGIPVSINLGKGYNGVISIDTPKLAPGSSKVDGTIGGDLQGYSINQNAEVIATFTNGKQSSVGKIAVYHFLNEQGLERLSGTRFHASSNSGSAYFIKDVNGQNINSSAVKNFHLENSNVAMSYGLTELLVLQRSYNANSKSITTADEMMKKALSMGV